MNNPRLPQPPPELLADLPGALLAALPLKVRESVSIRTIGDQAWEIGHSKDTRLRTSFAVIDGVITADTKSHAWTHWLGHRLLATVAYAHGTKMEVGGSPLQPVVEPKGPDPWPTFESWLRENFADAIRLFGEAVVWSTIADIPENLRDPAPKAPEDDWDDPGAILDSCAAQEVSSKPEPKKKRRSS